MFVNHRINLDSLIVCKIVLFSEYMIFEYGVLTPFPVKARFLRITLKSYMAQKFARFSLKQANAHQNMGLNRSFALFF